jgi:DNA-binding IclR family transcriptional regulator
MESSIPLEGRFRLLFYLIVRPRTPTELAKLESKHLSGVSRSLRELREMGYVEYTPSGSREKYYRATIQGYYAYLLAARQSR